MKFKETKPYLTFYPLWKGAAFEQDGVLFDSDKRPMGQARDDGDDPDGQQDGGDAPRRAGSAASAAGLTLADATGNARASAADTNPSKAAAAAISAATNTDAAARVKIDPERADPKNRVGKGRADANDGDLADDDRVLSARVAAAGKAD